MAEDAGRRRFAAVSALAELRLLAGLLKPGLAALLDPCITGQHAAALQLGTKRGVDLGQRASDSVADCRGLSGDATTVDPDAHIDVALIAALDQRLPRDRLQIGARE